MCAGFSPVKVLVKGVKFMGSVKCLWITGIHAGDDMLFRRMKGINISHNPTKQKHISLILRWISMEELNSMLSYHTRFVGILYFNNLDLDGRLVNFIMENGK